MITASIFSGMLTAPVLAARAPNGARATAFDDGRGSPRNYSLGSVGVAGLVLDRLERIPEVGDQVVVEGVLIEVLGVEEFAIQRVRLQAATQHDDDSDSDTPPNATSTDDASIDETSNGRSR